MTPRGCLNMLKAISAVLALCFWFSSFFLWTYFDAHETTVADPAKGNIYPLETHGSVVYLTLMEHYILYGLIYIAIALFLLAIVLYFKEKGLS